MAVVLKVDVSHKYSLQYSVSFLPWFDKFIKSDSEQLLPEQLDSQSIEYWRHGSYWVELQSPGELGIAREITWEFVRLYRMMFARMSQ